jgi:acetyl-CoA carboxylase biotin carboxyl carrier protein
MENSQDVMRALLEAFEKSDWQEMSVTIGQDSLHVSRQPFRDGHGPAAPPPPAAPFTAPAPEAAAPAQPAAPAEPAASPPTVAAEPSTALPPGHVVESPSVGLFWRAPSPGAPPFVEVGQQVAEGDTLAIVEVMKLMNHVVAPVAGTIAAIVPGNGESVEYGSPLVVIDPGS